MIHEASPQAVVIFGLFVAFTLWLSFYLGARAKSAAGYFAAGGGIHWFVNGVAFAGDYLSAASFLGICGMIAFYGYDGFLYSIGYLAGWIVALFVVAEPLKRMGKYTFADALDSKFNSRGIKLAAALSTLAVSVFYLIPQMVGAGVLITPLLGFPHWIGVVSVGVIVVFIVTTAGMVSTTYVQFLKGSLLVFFSTILTVLIMSRGFERDRQQEWFFSGDQIAQVEQSGEPIAPAGEWAGKPYRRLKRPDGSVLTLYESKLPDGAPLLAKVQSIRVGQSAAGEPRTYINGSVQAREEGGPDLEPIGHVYRLPGDVERTGAVGPLAFFGTLQESEIITWAKAKDAIKEDDGSVTTIYQPAIKPGRDLLRPGNYKAFKDIRSDKLTDRLNFISLMLALFGGTASLPHILIRYYTVKDQASARKSTIIGIASIGFFYILTLYMGLGAMTSGALDVTNTNMAAPLLAKSFNAWLFAIISAIAFTTVLGTVSGLIIAASGAVAHDLVNFAGIELNDHDRIRVGKITAIVVGAVAIALGILFEKLNVTYLVGWAFSVAASANLPALVMLLFWKRTTARGITAAIWVGMLSSLAWILLSADTFENVYGWHGVPSPVPFSQPGIVTIPLGFVVLVVASLLTQPQREPETGA